MPALNRRLTVTGREALTINREKTTMMTREMRFMVPAKFRPWCRLLMMK